MTFKFKYTFNSECADGEMINDLRVSVKICLDLMEFRIKTNKIEGCINIKC